MVVGGAIAATLVPMVEGEPATPYIPPARRRPVVRRRVLTGAATMQPVRRVCGCGRSRR